MKPPKRKRVSETFETNLTSRLKSICPALAESYIVDGRFKRGDRVRVKVTKLERGK